MDKQRLPLDKIKVAAPCSAEWRFMYGGDRVRFCGQCNQNVYNLSALSREQAEDLIRRKEGHLCVRYYRRRDGTIITNNCPVGLRAIKEKYNSTKATILKAVLTFLAYLGVLWWYKGGIPPQPVMGAIASPYYPVGREPVPIVGKLEAPEPPALFKNESFIRGKALFKVTPVFHSAMFNGVGRASAVVSVMISENGEVEEAELIKGHPLLKEMAEEAARRWKFEPMNENGRPVRVESTITFRLGR